MQLYWCLENYLVKIVALSTVIADYPIEISAISLNNFLHAVKDLRVNLKGKKPNLFGFMSLSSN